MLAGFLDGVDTAPPTRRRHSSPDFKSTGAPTSCARGAKARRGHQASLQMVVSH
ncbi:hypothetical protein LEMLEM_LOCUS13814, partial [Lemmus lemmus]